MRGKRKPILLVSVLRIIAALCIFMFHFFVLAKLPTRSLGTIGLAIFFFLTGWLGVSVCKSPHLWFLARVKRILIPYWPVVLCVLIANRVIGYKDTTLINDILTFLGCGLFVDNPVYVISWFITMILMLDTSLYGLHLLKNKIFQACYLVLIYIVFLVVAPQDISGLWFFYGGFFIRSMLKDRPEINLNFLQSFSWYDRVNEKAFFIQNYTYSFFLVHAAVLVGVFHFLKLNVVILLITSFCFSLILSYFHNKLLREFS